MTEPTMTLLPDEIMRRALYQTLDPYIDHTVSGETRDAYLMDAVNEIIAVIRATPSPQPAPETDFPTVLKQMKERMWLHPWWQNRCEGTPLENDLPVLATELACTLLIRSHRKSTDAASIRNAALEEAAESLEIEGLHSYAAHLRALKSTAPHVHAWKKFHDGAEGCECGADRRAYEAAMLQSKKEKA